MPGSLRRRRRRILAPPQDAKQSHSEDCGGTLSLSPIPRPILFHSPSFPFSSRHRHRRRQTLTRKQHKHRQRETQTAIQRPRHNHKHRHWPTHTRVFFSRVKHKALKIMRATSVCAMSVCANFHCLGATVLHYFQGLTCSDDLRQMICC